MQVNPLTLKHCQQVTINTGLVGPGTLTLGPISGGPGVIHLTDAGGAPINGPVNVPSAGTPPIPLADKSVVKLHYVAVSKTGSADTDLDVQ